MKITQETSTAWEELKESFEELANVMNSPNNLAIFSDQLARAKVVGADIQVLITKLRVTKNGE